MNSNTTNTNSLQAINNRLNNLESKIANDSSLNLQLKELFGVYIGLARDMLSRLFQLLQTLEILELALAELKTQIRNKQEEIEQDARKRLVNKLKSSSKVPAAIVAASVLNRYSNLFEQYEKLRRIYIDTQSKILDILSNIQKYYEQKESVLLKHELRLKLEQAKKETDEMAMKQETVRAILTKLENDGILSDLRNKFLQSAKIDKDSLVDKEYKRNFLSDVENLERLREETEEES